MSKSPIVEGAILVCPDCEGLMTPYNEFNKNNDDANPAEWSSWVCELDNKMIAIDRKVANIGFSRRYDITNKIHGSWDKLDIGIKLKWEELSMDSKCPICDKEFPRMKQHINTKHEWFK